MPSSSTSFKVLLAPLDWGLGHATRCVPVIRQLLSDNCEVVIAASGAVESLLKAEFPQLRFISLFGYNVRYSAGGWQMPFRVAAQIPKILLAIRNENRWLRNLLATEEFDAVISDNRYGLFHPTTPCVFITHQLKIKAPFGWIEALLQRINYRYINRFNECWVPDEKNFPGLAGELSHPKKLPQVPVRYVGALSRFITGQSTEKAGLVILLSGPEPQRTLLEKQVVRGLKTFESQAVVVRGLPLTDSKLEVGQNVTVFNHLPAADLESLLQNASYVIARCGYSTVMDLLAVGGRGILIPTPGQTEQEYLARHLFKIGFAFCLPQSRFDLTRVVRAAQRFPYRSYPKTQHQRLQSAIHSFLQHLPVSK